MSNLTTAQQADLKTWLDHKDPASQPLPDSLKNVLIDRCLDECNKSAKVQELFEKYEFGFKIKEEIKYFFGWKKEDRFTTVLFFLSRTPDGQAVMEFLNVETTQYMDYYCMLEEAFGYDISDQIQVNELLNNIPKTLDKKMLKQFVLEGAGVGKTFDQALEIITKTYLLHFYV